MTPLYDPTDEEIRRSPHRLFALMRDSEPVSWSPRLSGWVVTSYQLVSEVLATSGRFSADRFTPFQARLPEDKRVTAADVLHWFTHWMVFRDPPDHTRLRRH